MPSFTVVIVALAVLVAAVATAGVGWWWYAERVPGAGRRDYEPRHRAPKRASWLTRAISRHAGRPGARPVITGDYVTEPQDCARCGVLDGRPFCLGFLGLACDRHGIDAAPDPVAAWFSSIESTSPLWLTR